MVHVTYRYTDDNFTICLLTASLGLTKLAYDRCFMPLKIVKIIVIIAKTKLVLCLV